MRLTVRAGPKSSVQMVTGQTARLKGVEIDCDEVSGAANQIREWMRDGG